MDRRLRAGRFFGVEVFVDWSWIVMFVLAAGTLVSLHRRLMPDVSTGVVALAAVAGAAGLFASLGAHELVRVAAARGAGLPVQRLTLFVLGGVTDVERSPATPRTEVLGAVAAPAASFVVALVLGLGVVIASGPLPRGFEDFDRMGAPGIVLAEIAAFNLVIAVLNLLPAYPLDGGRLLRAALWRWTRNVERATRVSAWMGQVVGWLLVVVGLGLSIGTRAWGPLTALGAWTAFAGWFIASGAAQGYERVIRARRT